MATRSLSPSVLGAMEEGVKLKMPVALLGHATRAQNALDELKKTGSAEGVVRAAFDKFDAELKKLQEACDLVKPSGKRQEEAKAAWMERNVGQKMKYLAAMKTVFQPDAPKLQLNNEDVEHEEDRESLRSIRSRASSGSSARLARAEAAAKTKALELELEHRRKQSLLEEQEWKLRLQREEQEILLKIQQAKLLEDALEEERDSIREEPEEVEPLEMRSRIRTPAYLPPVATWAPRASSGPGQGPVVTTWGPQNGGTYSHTTERLLQQALLPQSALPTFKGEQLEFMWFLKAFETRVEAVTPDPSRRLHLLLQHLEGDPKTLVLGCQLAEDPAVGYARAKDKLLTKYGNKVRQALAFKTQLLAWPNIKKDAVKDLERFSIQLQLCEEVKLAGGLGELDAAGTLLQLMHKLPLKMQESWQMRAYKIETIHLREANFGDFCRFVCDLAAARNHPVYGGKLEAKVESKKGARTLATVAEEQPSVDIASAATSVDSKEASTFAKSASASGKTSMSVAPGQMSAAPPNAFEPPCLFCCNDHAGAKCRKALHMTIRERRTLLKGLCFACLKPGHNARQCSERETCAKCKESHPTVLHFDKTSKGQQEKDKASKGEASEEKKESATSCATSHRPQVAVAVVPIKVWCTKKANSCLIKAILDPGSTATFATRRLIKKLGIDAKESSINLTTMTSVNETVRTQVVSGIRVAGLDENDPVMLPPTFLVDEMPYQRAELAKKSDVEGWPHLGEVPFAWCPEAEVELLIGMNCPEALKPQQVVSGEKQEPYAVKTILGWCVNGPLKADGSANVHRVTSNLIKVSKAEEIQSMLQQLHYNDFDEAYDFQKKAPSQEDQIWLDKVEHSICKAKDSDCGQYQIALPFRYQKPPLQDNRKQALSRLMSLHRKFDSSAYAQFRKDYTAFMTTMESRGYVEEVNLNDPCGPVVYYVPHHGVYHPRKPGKIRVVFNCSNKFQSTSLNDCLIPGPDLTNSLLGVLIRFRQEAVAFMADIESMFYRVRVPEQDRDALRYLWWPGGETNQMPKTFRMKVHLFGATSSPSCANFALRRAANEALAEGKIKREVCEAVNRNFYVDDCLKSMPTEAEALKMAEGLIMACKNGGFRLTKFVSSSKMLLTSLPAEERAKGLSDIDLNDKHDVLGALQERALGVLWNVKDDVFRVSVTMNEQGKLTRRSILRVLSSVYDPIGMVAPVVIVARLLFRSLTTEKQLGWDDQLEDDLSVAKQWKAWTAELPSLQEVEIPRCFRPSGEQRGWQLHVFCDASEKAFAAVAYLRQVQGNENARAHVTFVMGKARVSPPKVVTIPRLELTAAKLATEVATTVQEELQYTLEQRIFWTDSQTVLKYLNNKVRRFHTFVANRVCSILNSTKLEEWRYVPTSMNPADDGSRGTTSADLKKAAWLTGPNFLKKSEQHWPKIEISSKIEEQDPDVRALAINKDQEPQKWIEKIADRYSSFYRLKKAIQTWVNFINHLQASRRQAMVTCNIRDAERRLIQCVQQQYWPLEVDCLRTDGKLPKTSQLYKLSPHMMNGVVCIGSRLRDPLPIIPGTSRVAELIIRESHERQMHFGRQSTASHTLKSYWITGLNKLVRKVVKDCPSCQRRLAAPRVPRMGDLPAFRTEVTRAFESTGVDYFGPFAIKTGPRSQGKAYGVIFTCASTRAVHLEVAEDLSTSCFLNVLRRFVARRGQVKRLISDNGSNFVGAEASLTTELRKTLNQLQRSHQPVSEWLSKRGIEWSFNPPGASHHGGFWERLIRSIRRALSVLLPEHRPLTYDSLVTVLCEVESVLNNRPLTPVSEDLEDSEALTPNHLLLGIAGPSAPPGDFKRSTIQVKRQWRQVQHIANCFWRRWLTEYKVLLHQRQRWHVDEGRPMQLEDVVLVIDPVKPREYWPLGRVIRVHTGKDGRVRVVTIKTAKGTFKRPVSKVCRLEVASESCKTDQQ